MKCENCIHFEVCAYVSHQLPVCDSYAEPVKHGRWVDVGYKIRCSLCDHGVFLNTTDPVVHNDEKENFKYCPNCGAKMDGGAENV